VFTLVCARCPTPSGDGSDDDVFAVLFFGRHYN
jgi:hypothetical protein